MSKYNEYQEGKYTIKENDIGKYYTLNGEFHRDDDLPAIEYKDGHKVFLTFNNAQGLKCTGKTPEKFLISGVDKNFLKANAKIDGNTIILSSKQIKNPLAVRFCFNDSTRADVFNSEGLPMAPFRTDNW